MRNRIPLNPENYSEAKAILKNQLMMGGREGKPASCKQQSKPAKTALESISSRRKHRWCIATGNSCPDDFADAAGASAEFAETSAGTVPSDVCGTFCPYPPSGSCGHQTRVVRSLSSPKIRVGSRSRTRQISGGWPLNSEVWRLLLQTNETVPKHRQKRNTKKFVD